MQRPTKNLHKVSHAGVVLWIDEDQVLDEEETDHIVRINLVDRDAREAALEDFGDGFEAETVVDLEHEGAFDGSHDVRHRDGLVQESACHGGGHVLVHALFGDLDLEQFEHLPRTVRFDNFFAQ